MDSFTQNMLTICMKDENVQAKALANFMFREIVEDIHAAGKITDAEMEQLNREACNRAALLMDDILLNRATKLAFCIEAVSVLGWDPPVMTEELEKRRDFYHEIGFELSKIRDEYKSVNKGKRSGKEQTHQSKWTSSPGK